MLHPQVLPGGHLLQQILEILVAIFRPLPKLFYVRREPLFVFPGL